MASRTAHYNLRKDASTDNYDVAVVNQNLDDIDEQMYQNEVAATTPFSGASSSINGEKGIVPRPMSGDEEKFLCGDGTWKTVQGGGGGAGADEMTLDEYNALTTAQKNDGTIRFIPDGSTTAETSAIDMSSISSRKESSMDVSSTSDQVIISWLGGNQIGATFYYATPIDVSTWDKITFDLTTSSCYGGGSTAQQARWNVQIGLQASVPSNVQVIDVSDSRWEAVVDFANANTTYTDQELDVSELTGQYYLVINAHGWNAVIDDFVLEKIGATYPSQIKYMSKTYADGSGGGSSEVNYSTTEHRIGTWIDGSDLYERTINITTGSFSATQDMDISDYIDSTEVVHESIGEFNYTYQSASYCTPINGREVEIVNWNGAYKLRLNFGSGSLDSMDAYVTIRYTKTGGNS